jgi:hypothetical protein
MAAIYVAYGIYLLAIGPLETIVTPGAASATVRNPSPVGLFPVIAGGLVLYGTWSGRDRVAWAGGAFALLFGPVLLFSLAGVLIPLAVLLLASLALRRLLAERQTSSH